MRVRSAFARRVLPVVVTVLALLLPMATPAAAYTSHRGGPTTFDVWYAAGDDEPQLGPNIFHIIGHGNCSYHLVKYTYKGQNSYIPINCDGEKVVSIAPLGPNAHPLTWTLCYYHFIKHILVLTCGTTLTEDMVYTT